MAPDNAPNNFQGRIFISRVALVVSGALVCVLYLLMANNHYYFMQGSSSIPILLAKALAGGDGFREVWRIGQPPRTVTPPGFALMLSVVVRLFGLNLFAMKILNNLFGVAAFLGAYALISRRIKAPPFALLIAVFSSTLVYWVGTAEYLYAGMPNFAIVIWALAAFETADDKNFKTRRLVVVVALLTVGAVLVRGIGIAFPAAVMASLITRRGAPSSRRLWWGSLIVIAGLLSWGGWTLRNYLAIGAQDRPYLSKLVIGEPLGSLYWLAEDHGAPIMPAPKRLTPARLIKRLEDNGTYYLSEISTILLPPLERTPRVLRISLSSVWILFTLAGIARLLARERRVSEWFALATLAIAWLWPFPDTRFLVPIMPILLMATLEGAGWAVDILSRAPRAKLGPAIRAGLFTLGAVVCCINLAQDAAIVRDRFRDPPFKLILPSGLEAGTWRIEAYHSLLLLDHVAKNSPPTAKVMFHSIHACGLVTGRMCAGVPLAGPDRVMQYIDEEGIDYVVMDDEGGVWGASYLSHRFLLPAIEKRPERFRPVASINGVADSYQGKIFLVTPE